MLLRVPAPLFSLFLLAAAGAAAESPSPVSSTPFLLPASAPPPAPWPPVPGTEGGHVIKRPAPEGSGGGGFVEPSREGAPDPAQALRAPGRGRCAAFALRHSGRYRCRYQRRDGEPPSRPPLSEEVGTSAEDYPKPSISVQPASVVPKGGSFAIRCQGPYSGTRFSLYKGRILLEEQDPDRWPPSAVFLVQNARPRDGGRYLCYYHTVSEPFVWSQPSDVMEVKVQDLSHQPPVFREAPGTGSDIVNCSVPAGSAGGWFYLYIDKDPEPQAKVRASGGLGLLVPVNLTELNLDPEERYSCSFRQEELDFPSDEGLGRTEAVGQDRRSDFTEGNVVRMGLAAVLLVLSALLVTHACRGERTAETTQQRARSWARACLRRDIPRKVAI
ncbi:platelet glycoprotein VI-like [Rhinatrema bivittatum]|uniref:platelet glycoprotein VI-like n=1 Tax=Rhinatrema bivittatum TaxID=194408 RepID=UPI00112A819E|nr:platelet glycoprotein VI-like [Rhinatrema bivittatum]